MIEMRVILSGWQYLCKTSYLKLCRCYDPNRKLFTTLSTTPKRIRLIASKNYCSNKKNALFNDKNVQQKVIEDVIEHNKDLLRETEQRIWHKSNIILRDIKSTKEKVKEKMEEVIEVFQPYINHKLMFNRLCFQRENIYTIPNLLCVSRIVISPYLGLLVVQQNYNLALAVLGFAALTDLVYIL